MWNFKKTIVGPFFFETTINAARYQEIIRGFIANLEVKDRFCWFNRMEQLRILPLVLWTFGGSFSIQESF